MYAVKDLCLSLGKEDICLSNFVASSFFVDGKNCSPLGSGGAGTLPGTAGAAPGSTNPGDRGPADSGNLSLLQVLTRKEDEKISKEALNRHLKIFF